ncbi:Xyloglucan galactosyltransferase KATAMARI1 [Glycine soja]|nr:Xyloglucan galactosyltransferase KATAMARI1 [Glycine soja]
MRRRPVAGVLPDQMEKANTKNPNSRLCFLASLSVFFWFLLLYFHFAVLRHQPTNPNPVVPITLQPQQPRKNLGFPEKISQPEKPTFPFDRALRTADNKSDSCGGRYIFVHDLPSRFNEDIPEWKIMNGRDHFLVAGRITWDFRRLTEEESDWGNKLLFLPAAKNMSMLVVESSPWNANDFGIPYPTYFHPAKDDDVFTWQERMRRLERKWLFSFAGAPRPDNPKSIRGQIIEQCRRSKVGKLLECDFGESKCHSPSSIMQMFQGSLFCLQPQGDSYTRRSAFDSMLAGCIPVFFHPGSAYTQYTWHLPKNYTKYSVFIPEDDLRKRNVSIEERLSQIPEEEVRIMREEVIGLIPRLVYADPRSKLETLEDAFDVSVQAVIDKVTNLRKDIMEGRTDENFIEENSWKYALLDEGQREVGPHEWDPFFSKPKPGGDSDDLSAEAAKNSWKNEQRNQS